MKNIKCFIFYLLFYGFFALSVQAHCQSMHIEIQVGCAEDSALDTLDFVELPNDATNPNFIIVSSPDTVKGSIKIVTFNETDSTETPVVFYAILTIILLATLVVLWRIKTAR